MMLQYQSFPDASGDSLSLEKLKKLRLPELAGTRFLDVGCNEGFFCAYAKFAGALDVIGIDYSAEFIQRARQRFQNITFLNQSWDQLPEGPFDLILLASALHYAQDQAGLIARLMQLLSPNGTLVLELGVVEYNENAWIEVQRGIDTRFFPSWNKLIEVLSPYAWKLVAQSVQQAGDPVGRHVLHICRRKPVAYLLLQPSGFGKTSICRNLFLPAGIPVVAGDACLEEISKGHLTVSPQLKTIVCDHFSVQTLGLTFDEIAKAGLLYELVQIWLMKAGRKDFVLDSYIAPDYSAQIEQQIADSQFMTVRLEWKQPGSGLRSVLCAEQMADAFYLDLLTQLETRTQTVTKLPFQGAVGYLDHYSINSGRLKLMGWALDGSGKMPAMLKVEIGEFTQMFCGYERYARPDVQQHLKLPHSMYGFTLTIDLPVALELHNFEMMLKVYGGSCENEMNKLYCIKTN